MTGLVAAIAVGLLVVFVIIPILWAWVMTPRRRFERDLEQEMTPQRRRQLEDWIAATVEPPTTGPYGRGGNPPPPPRPTPKDAA